MITVYIGLGSNLNNPLQQIIKAINVLRHLQKIHIITCSSFYQSRPMGSQSQPYYINAVIMLTTQLIASDLLVLLQQIEHNQGRNRTSIWGDRTLDLDILLYGQQIIQQPNLTIPHYGIKFREFVLYPLSEIAPQLVLPTGEKLQQLLITCPINGLIKLTGSPMQQFN